MLEASVVLFLLIAALLAGWGWSLRRRGHGSMFLVLFPVLVGLGGPSCGAVVTIASLVSTFNEVGTRAVSPEEKSDVLSDGISVAMSAGVGIVVGLLALSLLLNSFHEYRARRPPAAASVNGPMDES